ncbi:hypothetical protein, conserved in T. vivax [Trypanosoma vivax Y486]|uniref:Uncharacterized protein n=1 Tax=Trypanosoma vivax (strain Y486) TaxID=1055687 RepID=F9WPG7_TRYVY|nr:hypothetical protein, conserved in T. vivax [Trypanosoma vivax Y486]|eukprot:CCD19444.1 hypothetical protein, conserved in T. vivax [Trypanosoma vivax Y486]
MGAQQRLSARGNETGVHCLLSANLQNC